MKYLFVILMLSVISCDDDIPTEMTRHDSAHQLDINLSGSLQNPAFSPDGNAIVFTRFRNGYNEGASDLFIYNLTTHSLSPLISDDTGNVNLPGSVWDKTTDSIVFSSEREPHDEIFIIPASGSAGDEVKITARTDKQAYEPSFSPDGEWIVFESHVVDVENDGVITKYKVDKTSEYINLTPPDDNCKQPNWSPIGDKILYQKKNDGKWAIWTIDSDGNNPEMVTTSDENATDAVFSYDGNWIIYSSENDNVELANSYKIPVDGGTPTRVTNSRGYDGAPSISPDGTKIAFEATVWDPDESKGATLWIMDISL